MNWCLHNWILPDSTKNNWLVISNNVTTWFVSWQYGCPYLIVTFAPVVVGVEHFVFVFFMKMTMSNLVSDSFGTSDDPVNTDGKLALSCDEPSSPCDNNPRTGGDIAGNGSDSAEAHIETTMTAGENADDPKERSYSLVCLRRKKKMKSWFMFS